MGPGAAITASVVMFTTTSILQWATGTDTTLKYLKSVKGTWGVILSLLQDTPLPALCEVKNPDLSGYELSPEGCSIVVSAERSSFNPAIKATVLCLQMKLMVISCGFGKIGFSDT